jgi:hypothetical protein
MLFSRNPIIVPKCLYFCYFRHYYYLHYQKLLLLIQNQLLSLLRMYFYPHYSTQSINHPHLRLHHLFFGPNSSLLLDIVICCFAFVCLYLYCCCCLLDCLYFGGFLPILGPIIIFYHLYLKKGGSLFYFFLFVYLFICLFLRSLFTLSPLFCFLTNIIK